MRVMINPPIDYPYVRVFLGIFKQYHNVLAELTIIFPCLALYCDGILQLLAPFYRDHSTLIWNGNQARGIVEIGEALARVPPSKHDIIAVDSTPMAGESRPLYRLILHSDWLLK